MNIQEAFSNTITQALQELLNRPSERRITLYTGPGGMDMFEEGVHYTGTGLKRQYVGKKPMRIIRKVHKLYKSHSGRYYFLYQPKNN